MGRAVSGALGGMASSVGNLCDVRGKRISVGVLVRVTSIPPLKGMSGSGRAETQAVLSHVRGTCKRVVKVDSRGYVEIEFRIRAGRHAGLHSVGLEPNHLLVQKSPRPRNR